MSDRYVLLEFENTQKRNAYIERAIFPKNAIGYAEYDDNEITKLQAELAQAKEVSDARRDEIWKLDADIAKLKAQLKQEREVVDDFANFGTRHDVNPTGQFRACGCFDSFKGDHWQSYIRSQDVSVRERAREQQKNKKCEV